MPEETHKKAADGKHLEKLTIKELREIAAKIPHERAILDMKKAGQLFWESEAFGPPTGTETIDAVLRQ